MTCPKCGVETPNVVNFCGNCGARLNGADLPVSDRDLECRLDAYFANHLRHRDIVEAELTQKISANLNTALVRFAVPAALLAALLSYMGIEKAKDIREQIEDFEKNIAVKTAGVNKAAQETVASADEAQKTFRGYDETFKGYEARFQQLAAESAQTLAQLRQSHQQAATIGLEFRKSLDAASHDITELKKGMRDVDDLKTRANNEPYRVLIHYPHAVHAAAVYQHLDTLRGTLAEAGFRVSSSDTIPLTVEKTEILVFSGNGEEKAKFIRELLLKRHGIGIEYRRIENRTRQFDIQLNLREVLPAVGSAARKAE